jgi:hypothetical protein
MTTNPEILRSASSDQTGQWLLKKATTGKMRRLEGQSCISKCLELPNFKSVPLIHRILQVKLATTAWIRWWGWVPHVKSHLGAAADPRPSLSSLSVCKLVRTRYRYGNKRKSASLLITSLLYLWGWDGYAGLSQDFCISAMNELTTQLECPHFLQHSDLILRWCACILCLRESSTGTLFIHHYILVYIQYMLIITEYDSLIGKVCSGCCS